MFLGQCSNPTRNKARTKVDNFLRDLGIAAGNRCRYIEDLFVSLDCWLLHDHTQTKPCVLLKHYAWVRYDKLDRVQENHFGNTHLFLQWCLMVSRSSPIILRESADIPSTVLGHLEGLPKFLDMKRVAFLGQPRRLLSFSCISENHRFCRFLMEGRMGG